jgi:2-oxoglutarate ferredoxin oxidoreductase subunit beta
VFQEVQRDPDRILLLTHEGGIPADATLERLYRKRQEHDPSDLRGARELADLHDVVPIGLLYHDPSAPRYDLHTTAGLEMDTPARLAALDEEFDHFAV